MLPPDDFAKHIYHVGSSQDLHSIIQSGLIPGGRSVKKERHAVFFTAVNPMFVDQHKEVEYDPTNPRIAVYNNQKKGLQFCQTRSDAIILYNTSPAIRMEKVVSMKLGEE